MPVPEVDGDLALPGLARLKAQSPAVSGCSLGSLHALLWALLIAAKQEKNIKDLVS